MLMCAMKNQNKIKKINKVSHVTCHMSTVTCQMSQTPTAPDPPPDIKLPHCAQ